MQKVGILSVGSALPKTKVHVGQLGITEKSVASSEDDTLTLAYQASAKALKNLPTTELETVFVGSETHVYAVKPTAGMLASFVKASPFCYVGDVEFACKSGTAAMQVVYNMVKAGSIRYGLAVGADIGKGAPGDVLEITAASGAAAFVLADTDKYPTIATIDDTISYNLDTPDFWRENDAEFPSHAGRFSSFCYEQSVTLAVEKILQKNSMKIGDFNHVVFHMPNGKLPKVVAAKLGATENQLEAGFVVPHLGNTFSANCLLGLISVLEESNKGEKILLCSYGSGSGSDAFILTRN